MRSTLCTTQQCFLEQNFDLPPLHALYPSCSSRILDHPDPIENKPTKLLARYWYQGYFAQIITDRNVPFHWYFHYQFFSQILCYFFSILHLSEKVAKDSDRCWQANIKHLSVNSVNAVALLFLMIWWRQISLWPSVCSHWSPGLWKQARVQRSLYSEDKTGLKNFWSARPTFPPVHDQW